MYASTSARRASASIRCAPSRTSSSITDDAADRAAPEPSRSAESETTVSIGSYLPDQRCRAGLAWNLQSVTREGTPPPKPIHRFQALLTATQRTLELLSRNLQEVFGEGDAERRRAAIEDFYTDDCVVYSPDGTYVGH